MNAKIRTNGLLDQSAFSQLICAYQASLPMPTSLESNLRGVVEAGLVHVGSMSRSQLAFGSWKALGGDDRGLGLAVALEYFQTASLILDDLPCMDDAQERRGYPCPHRRFGEAAAILGAIAFINRGHLLLAEAMSGCKPESRAEALALIDRCLGLSGLLNGQALDLRDCPERSSAEVAQIAREKTTPLFELALVLPALILEADKRELNHLKRLAQVWGLAYQLLDDLKDALGTTCETGKTTGRDEALARPNWAHTVGQGPAFRRLNRLLKLSARLIQLLVGPNPNWHFLSNFAAQLQQNACLLTPIAA